MGESREEESEVKDGANCKEVIVMDTPDKGKAQITTPISQFEDSPVFNFLNSLSPIEAVKSTHITQNLNALNFASVPSVFTSPHVNPLKESRFLRRQQALDPSKPEFSTDNGNKNITDGELSNFYCSSDQEETNEQQSSLAQVTVEKSEERPKLAVQLVRSLNYDSSSPITSTKSNFAAEFVSDPEFAANSKDLIPCTEGPSGEGLFGDQSCMEEKSQINQSEDGAEGDWSAISDVADLLIFDSPVDLDKSRPDDAAGIYNDIANDMQNMLRMRSIENAEGDETDHSSSQHGDGSSMKDFAEVQDGIAGSSVDNGFPDQEFSQTVNSEPVSNLFHGTRRRCLVFEPAGTRRKYLDQSTSSVSPAGDAPSNNKHLVPKSNMNNSRGILSGIGLHLNRLATATKEYKGVKQDASVSGRLVITPGSAANFRALGSTQEPSNRCLAAESTEREMHPFENELLLLEHAIPPSHNVKEEQNQTSPRKKRRRLELAGEIESACKRCNCKKSKCLKLYCECFAAGVYCVEPCSCQECFNKPIHDTIVLEARKQIESRNPLAFAPKVIRSSESPAEAGDDSSRTPASARHKRGCNCKKSGCLKKYCECYQGGVGCSVNCRCEGCKNAFGRKAGSAFMAPGIELEDDEIDDVLEKHIKDGISLKTTIQSDGNQNPESYTPATPSHFRRPSVQHPFSSNKKPPRSSGPYMENSALYASQGRLGKPNIPPPPKFDEHFETASEGEMPESFQGKESPLAGVKSSSPNSKRVSPPHCDIGMSPGRRSSRKLILKSIPAFPSLPTKD